MYFDRNGIRLFYINEPAENNKDKPTVLLFHGWTCDLTDWSFQIPYLVSLGYRVVAFDVRGHGHSAATSSHEATGDFRFETIADDAAALLSHLQITKPVIVMGHSLGATVASVFSIRHGRISKGLVVIDPPYYVPFAGHAALMDSLDDPQKTNLAYTSPQQVVTAAFGMVAYTADTPAWLRTWHAIRSLSMPGDVVTQYYRQNFPNETTCGASEGASVQFHKEKRPTPRLVIVSEQERVDWEKSLGIDGIDHVQMMDAGHWMHQQQAEEFNTILGDWLEKLHRQSGP